MGFVKSTSSTRCRYAACFTLGFVVASLVLAAMFWIIWCYLGLTIVQISDTQRRAVVNYSYTTPKTPTTLSPSNRTEVDGALESSINAISKSPVTPPSESRRRSNSSADLAKGDFAARPPGGVSQNSTRRESVAPSATSSTHERKSPVQSGGEEGGLHIRKISTSNTENRAYAESLPERDINPTQTYAPAQSDSLPISPRDERRPISRDSDKKDEIQSSRPTYRDPEFERDPPRRSQPGRRRYDDEDDYDDRGSPSRYDKRDRGRDTDDRYSKGDTRVYPDEIPKLGDRYPPRDSDRRRGDVRDREDRYRDRDDKYREDRYRDRDFRDREDRYRDRGDRYRDDDRYETRDRYKDDTYRDDRRRDDRYDGTYRTKDDQYDDRYPPRDDRYDERRRDAAYDDRIDRHIPRDDEDRYIPSGDRDYRKPIMSSRVDIPLDRKSGRPDDARRPTDYDRTIRDRPRTSYTDESTSDDRYLKRDDNYRRPSKYDDRDSIYPSRTKEGTYISRSTASMSRTRDDDRYSNSRDSSRYDDDDRSVDESRYISSSSSREIDSTRRDNNRDRQDYGGLERRSSSAEEEYRRENSRTKYYGDADRKPSEDSKPDYRTDDEYTKHTGADDDEYRRNRPRGDPDTDRPRVPDKYDRPIDDDDRPSSRYDGPRRRGDADIGLRKESRPRDAMEDDRTLTRRPERRRPVPLEKDRDYDDNPPRRLISDDRPSRSRSDTIDDRPLRPAVERSSEDRRPYRDDIYPEDDRDDSSRYIPPKSGKRETFVSSSTSPRDVVERDKRYHSSERTFDDYGKDEESSINAKDVIDAATKHSDAPNQNSRKVSYPVFNPRVPNLTSTDIILPGERRGTTIMSRRRRSRTYLPYSSMLQRDVVIRKKRDHEPGSNFVDYADHRNEGKRPQNVIEDEMKTLDSPNPITRRLPYPINVE